jgi:hypothetical protein
VGRVLEALFELVHRGAQPAEKAVGANDIRERARNDSRIDIRIVEDFDSSFSRGRQQGWHYSGTELCVAAAIVEKR